MKRKKISLANIFWQFRKYLNKFYRLKRSGKNKHRQQVLEKHIVRLYKKLAFVFASVKRPVGMGGIALCSFVAPAYSQLNFDPGVDFLYQTAAMSQGYFDNKTKIFDIDGDGDKDAFFMGDQTPAIVYKNNGSGVLSSHQTVNVLNNRYFGSYVHNLDGDGDLDIVIRLANNKIQVMTNNGSGTFSLKQEIGSNTAWENSNVATGDVDGDGDIDIVSVEYYNVVTYKNDGAANFSVFSTIVTGDEFIDGKLIDLDRDNDLDFLLLHEDNGKFYMNNGSGTFTLGSTFGNNFITEPMMIGDFNNDGFQDCHVSNLMGNGSHGILYNNGTMTPAATGIALASPRVVIDIDNDNDIDMGVGSRFYLNNGSGTFSLDAEDFTVLYLLPCQALIT